MIIQAILKYVSVFLVAYLFSLLLVPLVRRAAERLGAIDEPGGRRIHSRPIARGGGVAVFASFHISCWIIFAIFPDFSTGLLSAGWWRWFLLCSGLLLIVGVMDDLLQIGASFKLCGQVTAGALMYLGEVKFQGVLGIGFWPSIDFVVTVLWFVVLVNAFNFIDGYDGLAAGLAAIAALGIVGSLVIRHMPLEAMLLVAFIGACLGFLKYNLYPASVFLGDSGSMFLGFALGAFTLSTSSKGTALGAIWVPMLALGVPLFDTMLALWRRTARKILGYLREEQVLAKITAADSEHIHHKLVAYGITPRNVTSSLYLTNSLLVLCGLFALVFHDIAQGIFSLVFIATVFVMVRYIAKIELWESGLVIVRGLQEQVRPRFAVCLFAVIDLLTITVSLLLSDWLLALPVPRMDSVSRGFFPPHEAWTVLLLFFAARPYYRILKFPRLFSDYLLLGLGVLAFGGGLLLLDQTIVSVRVVHTGLFVGIFLCGSSSLRLFPDWLARRMSKRSSNQSELQAEFLHEASNERRKEGLSGLRR